MNDTALIKAAQKGDANAFERLLEQYYDSIFRFAMKWSGNRHDAEDIAQQVCLKLAQSLAKFRFEAQFSSWLYRIVINTAKDFHSREQRTATACVATPPAVDTGAEEAVILLHQILNKADSWGEGFKESLLLVHGEGLSHAEAAKILQVKESTISWRLHQVRKKLAAWQSANRCGD
ncbi:MAG: RNA polymerase sigma factor [Cellvibrionaceae bacterium]|nr:RNA polymerase sigma factor [Cellvibrionaceae bacterium]